LTNGGDSHCAKRSWLKNNNNDNTALRLANLADTRHATTTGLATAPMLRNSQTENLCGYYWSDAGPLEAQGLPREGGGGAHLLVLAPPLLGALGRADGPLAARASTAMARVRGTFKSRGG